MSRRDEGAFSGPWPAPAKLNLMLRIIGRRSDGYHQLQTVFQFIDRCDALSFRQRTDAAVRRVSDVADVPEAQDLSVRAARLLQEYTNCRSGVDIRIDKRLPMGGGLGGGSSDAATTLVALNRLWDLGLGEDVLAELGLSLGADVPVFVRGKAAWAEGVGERLQTLSLEEPWYLLLLPPVHVSTAEVFAAADLKRDSQAITTAAFLAGDAVNDCLPLVKKRYQPVAEALDWLDSHGGGRLTGTGACVFAAFADERQARIALAQAPQRFKAFVARGINRSPLLDAYQEPI
jgi:4-diphosphocytidyl-2-C-methyl-D-erythritol kinase